MPIEEFKIRSKDVQEVLTTPPKLAILWGNTLIISIFCAFLVLLSEYNTPINEFINCKIVSVSKTTLDKEVQLHLLLSTALKGNLNSGTQLHLIIMQPGNANSGKLSVLLVTQNSYGNKMDVIVRGNANKSYGEGMYGVLVVKTGDISILRLFVNKIMSRL
jgi:hypothetical protein